MIEKLLPISNVLELNKDELAKYVKELTNAFMELDFEYKKMCKELIEANNKLEEIMTSVEEIYNK